MADKASRDAAMSRMDELMKTDDRFSPEKNPMPFDGKRLIYGGSRAGGGALGTRAFPRGLLWLDRSRK